MSFLVCRMNGIFGCCHWTHLWEEKKKEFDWSFFLLSLQPQRPFDFTWSNTQLCALRYDLCIKCYGISAIWLQWIIIIITWKAHEPKFILISADHFSHFYAFISVFSLTCSDFNSKYTSCLLAFFSYTNMLDTFYRQHIAGRWIVWNINCSILTIRIKHFGIMYTNIIQLAVLFVLIMLKWIPWHDKYLSIW